MCGHCIIGQRLSGLSLALLLELYYEDKRNRKKNRHTI